MSMLTTTISRLEAMAGLATSHSHTLAHKALMTDELGVAIHALTAHVDDLGVSQLMARAAADDANQALGLLAKVNDGYATTSFKSSLNGDIRRAIEHAISHLV